MSATRKNLIRRLARLTGLRLRDVARAAHGEPITTLARHVLARAYPQGVEQ